MGLISRKKQNGHYFRGAANQMDDTPIHHTIMDTSAMEDLIGEMSALDVSVDTDKMPTQTSERPGEMVGILAKAEDLSCTAEPSPYELLRPSDLMDRLFQKDLETDQFSDPFFDAAIKRFYGNRELQQIFYVEQYGPREEIPYNHSFEQDGISVDPYKLLLKDENVIRCRDAMENYLKDDGEKIRLKCELDKEVGIVMERILLSNGPFVRRIVCSIQGADVDEISNAPYGEEQRSVRLPEIRGETDCTWLIHDAICVGEESVRKNLRVIIECKNRTTQSRGNGRGKFPVAEILSEQSKPFIEWHPVQQRVHFGRLSQLSRYVSHYVKEDLKEQRCWQPDDLDTVTIGVLLATDQSAFHPMYYSAEKMLAIHQLFQEIYDETHSNTHQ